MLNFGNKIMKVEFSSEVNPTIILYFIFIKKFLGTALISEFLYTKGKAALLKIFIFVSVFNICFAHIEMGEQCDWTGSGLEMSGGKWTGELRGITSVYLRCFQGRVSWVYPRGGLRVLLRLGSTGKDFTGCLKVNPSFAGARIFTEEKKMLKELYSPNDGFSVKLSRCFHSRDGQVALYVEAAALSSATFFPKYLAEFSYDLESVSPNSYDPQEKCKPCGPEELMRAFCTNDLVVNGFIEAIHQEDNLDESEIIVRADRFLKYSSFEMEYVTKNDISNGKNNIDLSISIMTPKICQPKPGSGRFVFMARKRFDEYSLVCAPRWDDWKQLVLDEKQKGNSHCVLNY